MPRTSAPSKKADSSPRRARARDAGTAARVRDTGTVSRVRDAGAASDVAAGTALKSAIRDSIELGRLFTEKCELKRGRESFETALDLARQLGGVRSLRPTMEALAGLLRLAGEGLAKEETHRLETELDALMKAHPDRVPPMAWFCKGAIARSFDRMTAASRCFRQYILAVRKDQELTAEEREASEIRGWMMIAVSLQNRGHLGRSQWLGSHLLAKHEAKQLRTVNGTLYLLQGTLAEARSAQQTEKRAELLQEALGWYQKAHSAFLAEHNWYSHLYALLGYARVARHQQAYVQTYFYLDMIEKAASGPGFGALKREIEGERRKLQEDAVDVLIDTVNGNVKVREVGQVSLRKQFVLLGILEALSEGGLSKAEIIERVWNENYRPEAHDNKLYYNINRLRKLIEPDVRQPRYLLNWKEGYRFAPGVKVRVLRENPTHLH